MLHLHLKKYKNMIRSIPFISMLLIFSMAIADAQNVSKNSRIKAYETRSALAEKNIFKGLEFKNIGPTVFSGRVTDLAVNPNDPTQFYVAYASGGLWETKNNGTSFTPIFDQESSMTIGAIACDWEDHVIWVGTGEVNSSRSSYAGTGIFNSKDGGKSWNFMGLPESHHIGRIHIDPKDPNIVYAAVLGHLYTNNEERGLYRTIDAGKNWEKILFINDSTGVVDLISDPLNGDILYATAWERSRSAWNFKESGEGSGIYKSTDKGDHWEKLTVAKSGFPQGMGVGRIGLSMYNDGKSTKLYALLDNYDRRPAEKKVENSELNKDAFNSMSSNEFKALDNEKLENFLRSNGFPEKYTAESVKALHEGGKIKPEDLKVYLEDANSLLFDTPVKGAEVYVSEDGGKGWSKTHDYYLDQLYNSYGYYFGLIRVSPQNPDKLFIAGVPILKSEDGGKHWKNINGENVHGDHHALWVNPERDDHLILGNDGGVNISYDAGENWIKCNSPSVGQFYYINVDMDKPYNVYGGTQDNGVWKGSNQYRGGVRWHNLGNYPYEMILGGDGMQVMVDTRTNDIVYTGFQFGNYFRINTNEDKLDYITPKHELGERPFRWNWQTPIHLSMHNQDVLYMGSNYLHRSLDKGEHFERISPDLTKGGRKGDVAFGTITSIHESSLKFGLIYTGSDDGLVHVSKDGGNTWLKINEGLPEGLWVSRIQASKFNDSIVYLALNGYRNDDFSSYLYRSSDYGTHWERIGLDLPMEPINVVKEDPIKENQLYVGTDHGVYLSLNQGKEFMRLANGIPQVPVHDLVIHPTQSDLIVGTHGRSIYKMNISAIQEFDEKVESSSLFVYHELKTKYRKNWGNKRTPYDEYSTPDFKILVYSKTSGMMNYQILNEKEIQLSEGSIELNEGVQSINIELSIDKKGLKALEKNYKKQSKMAIPEESENGVSYLLPGSYTIYFSKGDEVVKKTLNIEK
jgi:photosystem II stability/assembly factor-like uncharacterized protein